MKLPHIFTLALMCSLSLGTCRADESEFISYALGGAVLGGALVGSVVYYCMKQPVEQPTHSSVDFGQSTSTARDYWLAQALHHKITTAQLTAHNNIDAQMLMKLFNKLGYTARINASNPCEISITAPPASN